MKTIIAEGSTPDLAFNDQLDFVLANDATKAFSKNPNQDIQEFAKEYLYNTFQDEEGLGGYIVLQKPKNKTTKIKYKIDNIVNKVVRKWVTITNFMDEDIVIFKTPSKETTKALSIKKAKSLTEELGKTITIVLTKEVSVGSPITAIVSLAKDRNTDGKYFFFGVENKNPINSVDE